MIKAINPSTEEVYGALEEFSFEEIEAAVKKAKMERMWADMPIEERKKIIMRFGEILEKRKEEIARVMAGEIGKPLKAGRHEIDIAKKRLEAFCSLVPDYIKDEINFEDENEKNVSRFEPLGVVSVISPWNAPIFVSLASIIPALLSGNNVIYKPSEYAGFSGLEIARIFDELKKEGMPENAFQIAIGGKEVGRKLTESDIDMIALTGSVRAGQEIMRSSADKLHRIVLELGGKDAAIVLEDADIERAAKEIVRAGTMYSGQVCFGVERCYVHEKIYDEFIKKCIEEMKKIKVGEPFDENTDIGPLSVKFQFDKVLMHINDASQKGAKLIYGGNRIGNKGYFLMPGIMTNVNHDMLIMKEETFGPIITIMKFENTDEAIKLANDSSYGLTASIWTSDLKKGEEVAKKIEAGTVEINRHGMSKIGMPWGGYKMSGIGRIYSKEGVRSFCNVKHVWVVK